VLSWLRTVKYRQRWQSGVEAFQIRLVLPRQVRCRRARCPTGRGAGPTGLPNAWFSELDDALFKAGDPDRRKLMDKHTNDFDDFADKQWAPRAVKRYREKMKSDALPKAPVSMRQRP
jgi:hypothetical protein